MHWACQTGTKSLSWNASLSDASLNGGLENNFKSFRGQLGNALHHTLWPIRRQLYHQTTPASLLHLSCPLSDDVIWKAHSALSLSILYLPLPRSLCLSTVPNLKPHAGRVLPNEYTRYSRGEEWQCENEQSENPLAEWKNDCASSPLSTLYGASDDGPAASSRCSRCATPDSACGDQLTQSQFLMGPSESVPPSNTFKGLQQGGLNGSAPTSTLKRIKSSFLETYKCRSPSRTIHSKTF